MVKLCERKQGVRAIFLTVCDYPHALILTAWNPFQTSVLHLAAALPELTADMLPRALPTQAKMNLHIIKMVELCIFFYEVHVIVSYSFCCCLLFVLWFCRRPVAVDRSGRSHVTRISTQLLSFLRWLLSLPTDADVTANHEIWVLMLVKSLQGKVHHSWNVKTRLHLVFIFTCLPCPEYELGTRNSQQRFYNW